MFGRHGYEATTARKIAQEAGVPAGLINYHFGSKEGLYRAVLKSRAPTIYDRRIVGLQLARSEPDLDRRVELVVKALIIPMLGLRGDPDGAAFGRILWRELVDSSSEGQDLFQELLDPIARMMIDALGECFPDWTAAEVNWAYHTLLGAMMIVMMDSGRIARLSGGAANSDDYEAAATHIVAILTAGLRHRDRSQTREANTDEAKDRK